MMNLKKMAFPFIAFLCLSEIAVAHPGHDHEHWSSYAVHGVYFVSLMALVVVAVYAVRRKRLTSKSQK